MGKSRAMVASGHQQTSQAAAEILQTGGNAFDAIVAAGFAKSIAEPTLTSLAGGGFLLAHQAQGTFLLYDFFGHTPGLGRPAPPLKKRDFFVVDVDFGGVVQPFHVGLASVAVPGVLKGLLHVHAKLGRLSLARVLEPAIRLATEGVLVTSFQASTFKLLYPILTQCYEGQQLYAPGGETLVAGERFKNLAQAGFMNRLIHNPKENFYQKPISQELDQMMLKGHGLLTAEDLQNYSVVERQPQQSSFKGFTILSNAAPSVGGILSLELLRHLEQAQHKIKQWGSAEHLESLYLSLRSVDRYREQHFPQFSRGTTHLNVCDQEGNVAAMTTSNGEGCGAFIPGTGVMFNNLLGEDDLFPGGFHNFKANQRIASMMAPTFVIKNDQVMMSIGSGGSKRIRTAIPQTIFNRLHFSMPLAQAVEAPRVHWEDEVLHMEPGYPQSSIDALKNHHPQLTIQIWDQKSLYFGGTHALEPLGDAHGDSRRGGEAIIL